MKILTLNFQEPRQRSKTKHSRLSMPTSKHLVDNQRVRVWTKVGGILWELKNHVEQCGVEEFMKEFLWLDNMIRRKAQFDSSLVRGKTMVRKNPDPYFRIAQSSPTKGYAVQSQLP